MINKRMEETNTTFIFKINHFGHLRFSVPNIYEALKLNDLCYLGFVKVCIFTNMKFLNEYSENTIIMNTNQLR